MASLATSAAAAAATEVTHLSQRDAAEIDQQLMGPLGFSVDQLMVSEREPSIYRYWVVLALIASFDLGVRAGARGAERRGSRCGGILQLILTCYYVS
jgi:hypothetical protein